MTTLYTGIGSLIGCLPPSVSRLAGRAMSTVDILQDAYLVVTDGIISDYGQGSGPTDTASQIIDLKGQTAMPGFCDSHTHIVFADWRSGEWSQRQQGKTYEEIAAAGGGILNSALRLQATDEVQLYDGAAKRLEEVISLGTTAIEIKSGYGLTFDSEVKMLRVIQRLKANYDIHIKATFLGAHAIPTDYKGRRADYIRLVTDEMLPYIADHGLADYIDVFCDEGFFTVEETTTILEAGATYGLKAKIHANELANSGGVQVGIANGAISVDHLEESGPAEIAALAASTTLPTALPTVSFFLGIPYAPARDMIDAGLPLVLATDYNPGSSPSGNLQFVNTLACYKMGLTPEEAFNATTINGAAAIELADVTGSITVGKSADFVVTDYMQDLSLLPYRYAGNIVQDTYIKGKKQ